jgi:hypothetical protein
LKGLVYSIKLKLEFAILGKLVKFVGSSKSLASDAPHRDSIGFCSTDRKSGTYDRGMNVSDFVDLSKVQTNVTHPSRQTSDSCISPRRRSSRIDSRDLDLARFRHADGICTLEEDSSDDASQSSRPHKEDIENSPG